MDILASDSNNVINDFFCLQVILHEACVDSDFFSAGEPVLLTMDKAEIKVMNFYSTNTTRNSL